MKRILPLLVIGIFIVSGLQVIAQPNQDQENELKNITINFSQPIIKSQNDYISLLVDETNSFLMKQGKPILPSYSDTYYFPFGTKIKSVTVTPHNIQLKTITNYPQPTPQIRIINQQLAPTIEEPINYGNEPYPSSWYNYRIGCGLHDGELNIIVDLQIYPIRYHPIENKIEWIEQSTVTIEIDHSTYYPMYRDNYDLVVIGPSEYSSQISPLITHKIDRGITSKFVSLTDIYGGTYFPATGRDNQEKIKYFIKNAIENWSTGNILLVGGSSKVPVRDTHVNIASDPTHGNEIFISDLYYADIYDEYGSFCSWDSNGNNIFGEYNWGGQFDIVDLYPDVYLTRLPSTTTTQVTTCVNKIKTYENTPGFQQSWFPNFVNIGGDTFEDNHDIDEGEYRNQKAIDIMTGFIPNKNWVTNGKLTSFAPTGVANIKSAINDGCGFVDFSGHGNTNVWSTHPHDNFNQWVPTPFGYISSNDILTLSNGNKLPIAIVEACSTAKFATDSNCFNWAFMYNGNGGAIGTFGATGLGYGYNGASITQGLIGKISLDTFKAYKLDMATTFGEMWAKALDRYITSDMDDADYKTVEEWNGFGDPTLAIAAESKPPVKPARPNGPASGKVGTEYTYTTSTTDPDGDKIYYLFNWDDGTTSGWVGPFTSGSTASAKKTWSVKRTYNITVVAKDDHGVLSEQSDPLSVSMPRSRNFVSSLLLDILTFLIERFPLLQHFLSFPLLN